MRTVKIFFAPFLLVISWFYRTIVEIRNLLYDVGFYKTKNFEVPIISIGNFCIRSRFDSDGTLNNSPSISEIPLDFKVKKAYPNPFNPALSISFTLPKELITEIAIYNMLGEKVDVLVNNLLLRDGNHTVYWSPDNQPSGMYLVNINNAIFNQTKKAFLVK